MLRIGVVVSKKDTLVEMSAWSKTRNIYWRNKWKRETLSKSKSKTRLKEANEAIKGERKRKRKINYMFRIIL
jgi:hypothetical protein